MKSNYYNHIKRLFDLILSMLAFILSFPLMVIIYLSILLVDGYPVIFKQTRPGHLEKPFKIFKFRTMKNLVDHNGKPLPDKYRLTGFGKFLRKTSLDELPELWNVIRGDMSLVGPRPLLVIYSRYLTTKEKERYLVKPGITGLAQISGRNLCSWNDRFKLDLIYVQNASLTLDLLIIVKTIIKVITLQDVVVNPTSRMLDLNDERERKGLNNGRIN